MNMPTPSHAIVCILLILTWNAPLAQTQGADPDWKERAQRAADAPFRWILLHSTKKPAKPAGKPTESPQTDRPAPAGGTSGAPTAASAERSTPSAPGRVSGSNPSATPPGPGTAQPGSVQSGAQAPDAAVNAHSASPAAEDASAAKATPVAASPPPPPEAPPLLKPLKRNPPDIPAHVLDSIGDGQVTVRFTVLPNGTVTQLAVVKSTHARLDRYVLSAVSGWLFAPIATPTEAQAQFVFKPD
jgi:TonB family protein